MSFQKKFHKEKSSKVPTKTKKAIEEKEAKKIQGGVTPSNIEFLDA